MSWATVAPRPRFMSTCPSRAYCEFFEVDPERPCGLRAACRVLPPTLLHRLIVLAGARTCIGRLGVPIALEKEAEAAVAPVVAARNGDIDRRLAHQEAALGLTPSVTMAGPPNAASPRWIVPS
jgi:hypothetical protein